MFACFAGNVNTSIDFFSARLTSKRRANPADNDCDGPKSTET